MQAVYNTEERREQVNIEIARLKTLMKRISDMYLAVNPTSTIPPLHDPLIVRQALCRIFHKTCVSGISSETSLLGPCAENSTAFFKMGTTVSRRPGDVLTSKHQVTEVDIVDSADAAVAWLRADKTAPPPPRRKQDMFHSRLMLHP
eukprot:Blabericola_migrator_1__5735@NODE_2908_length_2215_cov_79_335661_g1506_i1_p3_GENE_NODE_2908_length_2215_cov_79_335661_g1506_i1NODE_2908_length_2215_cov_79_335661_g1506_i1_p3_ORF_typecomplete_len146_score15_93_NODE_2908_length_2215_cov_79_335661_g1506_i115041941